MLRCVALQKVFQNWAASVSNVSRTQSNKMSTPKTKPTYAVMVQLAIKELRKTKGASRAGVKNWIEAKYGVSADAASLRAAFKKGVADGILVQDGQKFFLTHEAKQKLKKPAKKATKKKTTKKKAAKATTAGAPAKAKKAATKKKTTKKKTTKTKKPATKKAKPAKKAATKKAKPAKKKTAKKKAPKAADEYPTNLMDVEMDTAKLAYWIRENHLIESESGTGKT
eukprot:g54183.t1